MVPIVAPGYIRAMNAAYTGLVRKLRAMRRYDEMLALGSALGVLSWLAWLILEAERAANLDEARQFKAEHMRQRAAYERAVLDVVECISEEPDGDDLVASILGEHRTIADALLDEE